MKTRINVATALVLLLLPVYLAAEESASGGEHHSAPGPNLIRLMAGYSFVPDIKDSESRLIPALGFDYQRFLTPQFYLGTYNDLELTNYLIKTDEGDVLERKFAFVTTIVAGYDVSPSFSVFAGPGYEFETHESFWVIRAGVEFMKELTEEYTISVPLYYDYKEVYGAFGFGLAIAKKY